MVDTTREFLRDAAIVLFVWIVLTLAATAAPEPLQRDTQTKALIQTELDLKSVTLTLGNVTVSDTAGIRTISLGSPNGTKIGAIGDKAGFLGATPIVRPTGNAFTALINLGLITSPTLTTANITGLDTALAARQPLDSDLTSIAALATTAFGRDFLALSNVAAAKTKLAYVFSDIGSTPTTLVGYGITDGQPLDSDLTAIAALATTSFGRDFNTLADAAAVRTKAGTVIGTDVQAFDSDLAAISALATTSFGRDFNTVADAAAARTKSGLGTISTQNANNVTVGTFEATGDTTLETLSVGGHTNVNGNRIKNVGAESVKLVDYLPDNAVHDASVNYTTQLNAAIAAAVAGTRIVELPEWPVSIDATITVNSPVRIVGKGGYGPVNTAPDASRLVWAGGAGGVMMTFTTQANSGGGLEFVTLDGNGIAGTCLVVSGSSYGHYDYCSFVNFTTGDGIKVQAGVNTASWNVFTSPYVDGLALSGNGHSGIYLTGTLTGSSGTACHNKFINPIVLHEGNRPAWILGLSDNNTIIGPVNIRYDGGTNAGFLCDPSEAALGGYAPFLFPSGNRIYHCQAGDGGWTQPTTTVFSPGFIDGYNQDNGQPDPVTNGTPLFWTDNAGNFFGGQINGATITKGVGGASIDLGSNILGNKFDLYHSGNTHLGFGIATSEMRMFVPTGGRVAIGSMSTADGTTFTEGTRLYPNGGLNIGGTADPGAGNLILSGTITSSNAIRARAFNGADLSIPNNAATLVTLDSERWDSNTIHSTTTNTGRLTCVTPGNYSISGSASFDINGTGFRFIAIRINGGAYLTIQKAPAVPGDYTELSVNTDFDLASTDYVELVAYQNSGGALNLKRFSAYSPEFSMVRNP